MRRSSYTSLLLRRAAAVLAASAALASCSGGGGSAPPAVPPHGASAPAPVQSPSPSPNPGAGATATATPQQTALPSPTAAASSPAANALPPPTAPPDAPGHLNVVPSVPAGSTCRAGTSYSIYVTSAPTNISTSGSTEAFTVYEPAMLCGNRTYPLILNTSGLGAPRTSQPNAFQTFTNAGYGVISADQSGTSEDGGRIRVEDPDQEGVMLLAVMDWAQARLAWLAYAPTLDGNDPSEPVMGGDGGSYGGMFQLLLAHVDKRHRLRAIAPQIAPGNLNFALFPGGVVKSHWDDYLFDHIPFDPFVAQTFMKDDPADLEDPAAHDFFGYHSADLVCNGIKYATNGDATNPGDTTSLPPSTTPPKINALFFNGVRDTLFDFNDVYENYKCFQKGGGDVRLLTYQYGHNTPGIVPDPYVGEYYPPNDAQDMRCGSQLTQAAAELAWFDRYLNGHAGSESIIPSEPCISLSSGDAVTVPNVPQISDPATSSEFQTFSVSLHLTSGALDQTVTQTLFTAPAGGALVLGIPHADLVLSETQPQAGALPMAFAGLCVDHASDPGIDLVDNQVLPLRGAGTFDVDLVGGGVRLRAGDKLEFCAQGLNDQFAPYGGMNTRTPTSEPIALNGSVSIAILPSQPTI